MIRLFIGCSANGEDAEAQALLEYTLRKHHAADDIELHWMMLSRDPVSPWYSAKNAGWNTVGWATPFSAFRWAIPHVCNYNGRAIYMDVDQIFMADVAELWAQEIPLNKCMLTKDEVHSCVILFDCERAKKFVGNFDTLRRTEGFYRTIRKAIAPAAARFAGNWNCLDGDAYQTILDPQIKVIHFTKVETQPHLKWALPRLRAQNKQHWNRWTLKAEQPQPHARKDVQPLIDQLWAEAQAAGYRVEDYEAMATNFGDYNAVRGGQRAA